MKYETACDKLNTVDRATYTKTYNALGSKMFSECYIPNVGDFANAFGTPNEQSSEAMQKIEHITAFTGNTKDIIASCQRRGANYTEEESSKFMKSVIAANVTNITESGFFYKKLISSCDNMIIDLSYEDCGAEGSELELPIDETTYNYKVKNHFITELNDFTESYEEFLSNVEGFSTIHIRSFLTCKHSRTHRKFCKTCAGIYKRAHDRYFIPKYIGVYSTLMITEHATQASLDSMNKGVTEKLNVALEQKIDKKEITDYPSVKAKINEIIDQIGYIGVQSRFYEIALLSRFYLQPDGKYIPSAMITSFLKQGDTFGSFIYKPSKKTFYALLSEEHINATSLKSKIAFDLYD